MLYPFCLPFFCHISMTDSSAFLFYFYALKLLDWVPQVIQENLPILRSITLTTSTKSLLPCKVTHLQILRD